MNKKHRRAFEPNVPLIALSAFVAGAAAGAVTALIMAPATGQDTRAYLKRRGNEIAHDAAERGRTALREQMDRVTSAAASNWRRAGETVKMHVKDVFESPGFRAAR